MTRNKFLNPFFIGAVLVLVSFFVSFLTFYSPKNDEGFGMSMSFSMKDLAFDGSPRLNFSGEADFYFASQTNLISDVGFPKIFGIYYTMIFILSIWAIIVYSINPELRSSNKKSLAIGITGLFVLSWLVTLYEIFYYKYALEIEDFGSVKMAFGLGFWGFIVGGILLGVGAFGRFDSRRGFHVEENTAIDSVAGEEITMR